MARLGTIDPAALPAEDLAKARDGQFLNRSLTLGHVPAFLDAIQKLEETVAAASSLEPLVRATAALAVVRRSAYETRRLATLVESAGLTDDMVEAIADEDWTEPALTARQRTALQYALKFDAGHGIQDVFFAELREQFSTAEIVELTAICACYGLLARAAIALAYDAA